MSPWQSLALIVLLAVGSGGLGIVLAHATEALGRLLSNDEREAGR